MTELRVMAVTGDGDRLVLRAPDGQEFYLAIDDRLRAAVRGDRARLGQIEIELDAQLRPRDIQARIRSGQTAEQVADLAGIPLERVRRFEGPVLAERAFMAERAQNTQVRRAGETHGPKLGDVVRERLAQREPDHDSAQWDSWRKEDGIWTVRLAFRISGLPYEATWSFDPPRRLVTPADDEARLLSSDAAAENAFPFVPRSASRPTALREERHPHPRDERRLGDPLPGEHGLPAEDRRAAGRGGATSVTPLSAAWHGGPRTAATESEQPAEEAQEGADSVVTPLRPVGAAAAPGLAATADEQVRQAGAGSAYSDALFPKVGPHKERKVGQTDQQAVNDGVPPGRRATVPSWDEIVFGTRRRKTE
ncbi:MAG TPA: septation protein SepH [Actinocrinis sp.]